MKKHRDVAIELTPLLYFIMILLFLIMMNNSTASKNAKKEAAEKVAEAEAQYQEIEEKLEKAELDKLELQEKNERLSSRAEGLEVFKEYARIVTISVMYPEKYKRLILINNDGTDDTVIFDEDSLKYGENTLNARLSEIIKESDHPVFLIFTYDQNVILHYDREMISSVMTKLQSKDVYIQTKTVSEAGE